MRTRAPNYKSPYAAVAWEEQRVALLRDIEHTEFFGKLRGDLHRLALQQP